MAFRIGRKHAQHTYPENSRAAALALFARNYATGPKIDTAVDSDGTQIPWNLIDSIEKAFTIVAGGVTVSIAGDVTSLFNNGDSVTISPTTPDVLPPELNSIATNPVFADGSTTFDLSGPLSDGTTTGGFIEDGIVSTTEVPITPRTTGVVLITGVVSLANTSGDPLAEVAVQVLVDGEALPVPVLLGYGNLDDDGAVVIPFMAEVTLPIGSTSQIGILVTGEGATIVAEDSTINVQEVSFATG